MTRWYLIGPLAGLAFILLITGHWFLFTLNVGLIWIVWEIADENIFKEIERYANRKDRE